MSVKASIFREYDIRGLVGEDISEEVYELLGKAYGTYLRGFNSNKAVVGYDNRVSSPPYATAFINGLNSTGVSVVNIGLVVSPLMYFARKHLNINGGAVVTASHNPPEFNGLKLTQGIGCIFGEEIQQIRGILESGKFVVGEGSEEKLDIIPEYIKLVKNKISLKKKLRVVLDCGNGTGSIITPRVLKELGVELIELYCESDGTFPNHHPDPTQIDAMKDLVEKVKETKADLGVAIDGDGDRLGAVDEKGNLVWGDQLMILFSREVLSKHKGAKVLFEVKCSQSLWEEIEKNNGKPVMTATGHSIIENRLHEEKALLAGEMSGHIYFADEYFGFDDATYAAARLLRILSNSSESISQLLATAPKYYSTPEIRVDCPEDKKVRVVEKISNKFKKLYPESVTIDGIRIIFENGWALVRKSNTQAKIILRFEAKTKEELEKIESTIRPEVEKAIQG